MQVLTVSEDGRPHSFLRPLQLSAHAGQQLGLRLVAPLSQIHSTSGVT